ncbi:MAG TPA: glycosyltransferase family 4 protein, partial [Actinomycetota bacterium]|nr:glycosyltransferase family 4 protein [Actinomycetota bacterium]
VDPGAIARMRAGLTKLRPSLVVAHGGEPLKYAVLADPRGRVPMVYRKISHAVGGRGERILARMYDRPARIFAVTEELKRELVEDFAVDPGRVVVIPTSRKEPPRLDADERRDVRERVGARDPDRPMLAWVGRLSDEKQPGAALQAFALIRSRFGPCSLAICGDGPLRESIENAAGAAGPGALVLGSRDDADRIIAASDLLLSTSRTEGAPGVLVEAGLAGVPVVAFDVGEVSTVVKRNETGVLVRPGDLDALADAACRLLVDVKLRARMSDAAREACRPFELTAIAERYFAEFDEVLGSSPPVSSGGA